MINYHTGLIIRIDCALLALYLIFAIALILYIIVRDRRSDKRAQRLLNIKNNIFRLFQSGDEADPSMPFIAGATHSDFLDVKTNRQKFSIFFNESEQQLFKESFIAADKVKTIEDLARRARNKWHRVEAIVALGYTQQESALGILEEALHNKDEDISYFAALAIGQISTMRSVSILMGFLKKEPSMRRKTASILETLSPDITDEVIKYADDPDPDIRLWAVRLLSRSVSKQYVRKVEELAGDPSAEVRAAACESLAKLKDKNSKEALIKRLEDEIWFVKMHAVRALSKIFGHDAMPEIIGLINDGSLSVLDSVKRAMIENIAAALPYMPKIFQGPDELAKKLCVEALETALRTMDDAGRNRILETIKGYDAPLAAHIKKILKDELSEL